MRLLVSLLGWSLDLSLEPTAADEVEADGAALNGGTTVSTPMGFMPAWPMVEEITAPQHCPSWDEPETRT